MTRPRSVRWMLALLAVLAAAAWLAWWAMQAIDAAGTVEEPAPVEVAVAPDEPHDAPRRARAAQPGESPDGDAPDAGDPDDEWPSAVTAKVVDDEGEPRPGATVRAARLRGSPVDAIDHAKRDPAAAWPAAWTLSVRTGADGTVPLPLTGGRAWFVHAAAEDGAGDGEVVDPATTSLVVFVVPRVASRSVLVRSREGDPLPGAEIHVVEPPCEGPPNDCFTAGADGRFELRAADRAPLVARMPGFVDARVRAGAGLTEIVMTPAMSIGGVVVDSSGAPVAGATVTVGAVVGMSDERGAFSVAGVDVSDASGPLPVAVTAEGFLDGKAEVWPGVPDARIVLNRGGRVSGRVTLAGGAGVRSGVVHVTRRDDPPFGRGLQVAMDSYGEFTVVLPPDRFRLRTSSRASVDDDELPAFEGEAFVDVEEGGNHEVSIVLAQPPWSWAAVRVVFDDGTPAEDPQVTFEVPRPAGGAQAVDWARVRWMSPACRWTDDGTARGVVLRPPGTRVRAAFIAQRRWPDAAGAVSVLSSADVVTAASDTSEPTTVRLKSPATVRVRVRVTAEGIEDGRAVAAVSGDGWAAKTTLGSEFDLRCLASEPLEFSVEVPGCAGRGVRIPPPRTEGATHVVVLGQSARVRGRIIDTSGAPVRRASVRVTPGDPAAYAPWGTTDGEGRFRVDGVRSGRATIHILAGGASGWAAEATTFDAPAGAEVDVGDIVLTARPATTDGAGGTAPAPAASRAVVRLRGRVTSADGQPVVAAAVRARPRDDDALVAQDDVRGRGGVLRTATLTGLDGRWELTLAAGVEYVLETERPGFGTDVRLAGTIPAAGGTADVRLGPCGVARIRFRPGRAVSDVRGELGGTSESGGFGARGTMGARDAAGGGGDVVRVARVADGLWWSPRREGPNSEILTSLPIGALRIAVGEDDATIERTVEIRAGATADVEF